MLGKTGKESPSYLTTKEVAALLRVKERKVYDLAAAGEIPHRRLTGKLLFPAAEIVAWINGNGEAAAKDLPAVMTGSHDPLLDWAVRESDCGLATLLNGSADGLALFAEKHAALTGLHVPEADGWNIQTVVAHNLTGCVLIAWAVRARGLLLNAQTAKEVKRFADLRGRRVVMRQPGSGAAILFDSLVADADLSITDIAAIEGTARTESDAAAAVAAGEADAALGIEAMARQFHLSFLPLEKERFDLLIDRRAYFTDAVQTLLDFARGTAFHNKAISMGGYDLSDAGSVRWLSP